ncbi:MAG: peptidylprolyl isomerase [Pseudanabaenaceae cyanobacterium]
MTERPIFNGVAIVTIAVNGRPIEVEINGIDAPITAGNFIDLVERGFYDGITFHRVVPNFVVQAGDPNSKDPNFPPNLLGRAGFVDPLTGRERTIPLEIKAKGAPQPTLSQIVPPPVELPHKQGVISMARTPVLDSASSQFFITLTPQPSLDGSYAVFGEVINGFANVQQIRQGDRITAAKVTGGIIPSRQSNIILENQVGLLNDFINFVNRANLGLPFADADNNNNRLDLNDSNNRQIAANAFSGVRLLGGNDTLIGSPDRDVVNGNEGNDLLLGEAGADYLRGGQGDDTIVGGEGNDILNGNKGNDSVEGGNGNDFVRGGQGNDTLLGGNGDDTLIGDLGFDILVGGAGKDTFVLRADDSNSDRIADFNLAQGDEIVIVGDNITLADVRLEAVGGNTVLRLGNNNPIGEVVGVLPNALSAAIFITTTADAAFARIG